MSPPRILCVAPNWLGDAVLARPALAALGRAGAAVEVLARSGVARVLEDLPGVVAVHAIAGGRAALLRAAFGRRKAPPDAALVFPPSFSAALVARAAGARRVVGWRSDGRSFLLHRAIARPSRETHLAVQDVELAAAAGGAIGLDLPARAEVSPAPAMPRLAARAGEEAAAEALRARAGFRGRPYLVVAPGARYGPAKRWPADRFGAAAAELARRLDALVVLVGDGDDRAASAELRSALPGAFDVAGRTGLGELLGLLASATAVLANDSGVMHLAAALGRPTVGIFGSTNPLWTAPLGPAARFVSNPVHCSPCYARTCVEHFECMLGIEPRHVVMTLVALVQNGADRAAGVARASAGGNQDGDRGVQIG
jgi:heptosyltransferase-2